MVHGDNHHQSIVHWKCPACGIRVRVPAAAERIVCVCDYEQLGGVQAGLGDWVAAILHRCGITRYRYLKLKKWLGLKPHCNCPGRQAWLNWLGRKLRTLAASPIRHLVEPIHRVIASVADVFKRRSD